MTPLNQDSQSCNSEASKDSSNTVFFDKRNVRHYVQFANAFNLGPLRNLCMNLNGC